MRRGSSVREILTSKRPVLSRLSYEDYRVYRRPQGEAQLAPKARDALIGQMLEPGATVLDIGCGDGRLMAYLTQTNGNRCTGIECSAVAVDSILYVA